MEKLFFIKKQFSLHGGAENYMKTLIDSLREDYEITVLSNKWIPSEGARFQNVPISNINSFFSITTFNRNACKILENMTADCTISFERTTCQDIYRAGEGCHAEWLEIRSNIEPFYKNLSFKINPLHLSLLSIEKRIFSHTGLIIANSRMVKDHILKHYPTPEERVNIIYNGVELKRFTPENKGRWRKSIREGLSIPDNAKLLFFVGSGFKRKGLKTLLDSIPLIKRNDIRVMVIGKGDINKYKILAKKNSISDRVIFLEPQKGIEKFYSASDLFILPTLYDPFSNATLEAMASGIPAITTRNNGAAEIITNGEEGFVMDDLFDAAGLADRITHSLDNLAVMGEKARKRAESFSVEKAAREFTGIIKHVTDYKASLP